MSDKFVYVTYIKTTPEKLWDALTKPEFTRQYWFGVTLECDWKAGSPWKMMYDDGRVTDTGEIVEAEKPKRIVIKWRNEFMPELKEEGWSRCVMELEPVNDTVKLTITHTIDKIGSKFIQAVSGGWPRILSSLKTMLETGAPLPPTK
jgi:uncharacterized protein YndB with AHSA1/START domain